MKGKLEKDIEQQLSDFTLQPTPQVWEEVEAALHPRRKRRVIAWWWFGIPVITVAGIALWFYTKQPVHNQLGNPVNNTNTTITNNQSPVSPANDTSFSAPATIHNQTQNTGVYNKAANHAGNTSNTNTAAITRNTAITSRHNRQEAGHINTTEERATHTADEDHAGTTTVIPGVAIEDSIAHTTVTSAKDTSLAVKKQDTATVKKKLPPDATTVTHKPKTVSDHPKHQWSIVAGGGFSLIKASTLFSANTNDAYPASTNSSAGYPTGTNRAALPTAQTGFHIIAGIQYEHTLGKHWQGYTGLQYRYTQNNQQVGNDSITSGYSLDNYFTRGNISTKHNYSHWLELPVYAGYIINPSAKNQVQLLGGASLAYTVAEKWLIVDNASKRYYYQASLNNHLLVNARAGIAYSYHNLFQLALWMQQSLTPIHQVTDKYYQQQFSLQVSVPLTSLKPKHTK